MRNNRIKSRTIILFASLLFLPILAQAQPGSEKKPFGLGVKASTMGFGVDFIYSIKDDIGLRVGFEKLGYQTNMNFDESGIYYAGKIDFTAGNISLLADFYLGKYVYLTAGAGYNMFHGDFSGHASKPFPFGDIEIPVEMIGEFDFQADPALKISPYLGLGFGRTIGLNKAVGLALDLGMYYQGSPQLTIQSTGLLSPTANPDHGHAERWEKQISQYSVYPIARLTINYKISSL